MASRVSFFRVGLLGSASVVAFGGLAIVWGSLVACESLSETSPLVDPDAATDYDVGYVPPLPDDAAATPPTGPDAGPPPPAGRIRLANLIQGAGAVDLCAKRDEPGAPWEPQKITVNSPAPNPDGLRFGQVSTHIFLPAAQGPGTKYVFRVVAVGNPCEGEGGAPLASIASTALRQGGGLTLVAFGVLAAEGADAGDGNPRGVAIGDVLSPPSGAALVRVFHGVPDMPAFDLVINGETAATGVKYGSAAGFPYTSPSGFASLAAGVPDKAKVTLRAGTTVKSYTIPERVRRGVAVTVFAGGSLTPGREPLTVSLCADRSPPDGDKLATCTKLEAVQE